MTDADVPPEYRHLLGGPDAARWRLHFERRARLIAEGPPPAPPAGAEPARPMPNPGAGAYLKRWLGWAGITPTAGCGCNDLAQLMDRMGPDWCAAHTAEILDAMRAEAHRRHLPFVRPVAASLLTRAIAKARTGAES